MNQFPYLILSLIAICSPWLSSQALVALPSSNRTDATGYTTISAILDQTSRPGKEAKVAIELAIHDFNSKTNQNAVFYVKDSRSRPVHAALAAKELLGKDNVAAIFGAHTWEEASAIAEVVSETDHHDNLPRFFCLADTIPPHSTEQWPFFVQAVPTQSAYMDAVAAILQSWGIHQATFIYETSPFLYSSSASIISHLSRAFQQTGAKLSGILPLPSSSPSLGEELEVLKKQERKIFVIHTSLEFGCRLFQTAKKMEMTGDGYLWIATNRLTDHFHSVNSSIISSLKGMVGVKTYFPENTPDFQDFRKRFRRKFQSDYPEEEHDEPGTFAVQAYQAVRLFSSDPQITAPASGTEILEIVNVIGKGYHSAYWTKGLGFSETVNDAATSYGHPTDSLGQILCPAQAWHPHRRRRNLAESSGVRMRVGVPAQSLFKQFVIVEHDQEKNETAIDGFVIAVFREVMKGLNWSYDLVPFNGSYNDLVLQLPAKNFDAIAGDVTILASRHEHADFTQPYTESGLEMIVPVRPRMSNRLWLFMRPFTGTMWAIIAAVTIYNGFIVWLIERKHNPDLQGQGSPTAQIGIIFWLSFTTLFTLTGDKLHSNLSRISIVVWLFVALIVTQSYTASLASMLTAQRLEPAISNVETLRTMNATVGYCNGSFINDYLTNVLHFHNVKVKSYNSTRAYAEALNSREIAAIFLEVPAAKVFLAQYCKSFIRTGETFKVGGFGFAFPKNFTRLSDVNAQLMYVAENKTLKALEDKYLVSEKCVDEASSPDEEGNLSINSFWVLFAFTGGTSTIALVIYVASLIIRIRKDQESMMSAFIKEWKRQWRQSSGLVTNAEDL